ncbi:MAG: ankyrin repeat domain-containing protein [Acidobacteriota bacterium]|nr:ankyrin repeat domain-containing protein [Acidobacteriota bacterium]
MSDNKTLNAYKYQSVITNRSMIDSVFLKRPFGNTKKSLELVSKMKFKEPIVVLVILLVMLCGCGKTQSKVDIYSRKVDVDLQREFAKAASNGNIEWMKSFLARGADVNTAGAGSGLPIINAAANGHTEAVRFLLDNGADVNAKYKFESTALIAAAGNGHLETVKLLLSRGADINAVSEGYSALRSAEGNGHSEVAQLLRELGAKK